MLLTPGATRWLDDSRLPFNSSGVECLEKQTLISTHLQAIFDSQEIFLIKFYIVFNQ